jgi:acyl-CoA reductase-like NAD-dependent aldehyde dehydrogenase
MQTLISLHLSVILFSTYENIDDAIELANTTTYSLTSSVWSKDIAKARDIAFHMRFGKLDIKPRSVAGGTYLV